MDERETIIKAKNGDKSAFENLIQMYQKRAYSFVFAHVRNKEDAKDIVQDVFIRLYESLNRIDENRKFFSYFYRMVQNRIISHYRKRKPAGGSLDSEEAADIACWQNDDLGADEKIFLLNALDQLPNEEKNIMILRYFEGLNDREIAENTGMTEENIRVKIHRAKKKMLNYLEAAYD